MIQLENGLDQAASTFENLKTDKLLTYGFTGLNLGCRSVNHKKLINIDFENTTLVDIFWDLRCGLNFIQDKSVDLIYSEHFWERLTWNEGERLAKECFRVLKQTGRIRIATVDLDYSIHKYNFDWKSQHWLNQQPWIETVKSRGGMLNTTMREWRHQYIYNDEDLRRLLQCAGFEEIYRFEIGTSSDQRFWDLETRQDSRLILEGIKN
jgi:predicted SAM-dependent methyltransferase